MGSETFVNVTVLVLDNEREKEIALGRGWPYRTLQDGEISCSSSALKVIQVPPNFGNRVNLTIDSSFVKVFTVVILAILYNPTKSSKLHN